jgi:hypothetical protein
LTKEISDRLLDQRLRNRIMESILWLSEGVGSWGADEYFNQFYDQMSFDDQPFPNTTMTANESEALQSLCGLMNRASAATPKNLSFGHLAESGWLASIQNEAKRVLKVFLQRGRCYEDQEGEPSVELGLSWYNQSEKLA